MRMKLYRVAPVPNPQLFIVAEDTFQAGEIFITYTAATGRSQRNNLMIEQYEDLLGGELTHGLEQLLERDVPGVATYVNGVGWSLQPPG